MKIAIDLTQIPKQLTGVGFYMENLVKGLTEIDRENTYYLFVKKESLSAFRTANANFHYLVIPKYPYAIRVLWEQLVLPLRLLRLKAEVLHSPHYSMPLLGWWFKRVVTFPDMTFFLFPEAHVKWKVGYFQAMIRLSSRLAAKIISISYATTKDIQAILSVPAGLIATTQLAVAASYRPALERAKVKTTLERHGISGEYILFVGTLEPRKNIANLVRAYSQLPRRIKERYKLVIVGKKGWYYQEIFDLIGSSGDSGRIICAGYVSEADLPDIYNGAALFVYPSLYEGFGIPVLEAMACGVPVITSNVSSMPEVLGGAGTLIDPNQPEEISAAMGKVLTDKALFDKMKSEGLARARTFSWQKCAEETLNVYENVIIGEIK